jgi:hypothetical protein
MVIQEQEQGLEPDGKRQKDSLRGSTTESLKEPEQSFLDVLRGSTRKELIQHAENAANELFDALGGQPGLVESTISTLGNFTTTGREITIPNDSGKSDTVRVVRHLYEPSFGTITKKCIVAFYSESEPTTDDGEEFSLAVPDVFVDTNSSAAGSGLPDADELTFADMEGAIGGIMFMRDLAAQITDDTPPATASVA